GGDEGGLRPRVCAEVIGLIQFYRICSFQVSLTPAQRSTAISARSGMVEALLGHAWANWERASGSRGGETLHGKAGENEPFSPYFIKWAYATSPGVELIGTHGMVALTTVPFSVD